MFIYRSGPPPCHTSLHCQSTCCAINGRYFWRPSTVRCVEVVIWAVSRQGQGRQGEERRSVEDQGAGALAARTCRESFRDSRATPQCLHGSLKPFALAYHRRHSNLQVPQRQPDVTVITNTTTAVTFPPSTFSSLAGSNASSALQSHADGRLQLADRLSKRTLCRHDQFDYPSGRPRASTRASTRTRIRGLVSPESA